MKPLIDVGGQRWWTTTVRGDPQRGLNGDYSLEANHLSVFTGRMRIPKSLRVTAFKCFLRGEKGFCPRALVENETSYSAQREIVTGLGASSRCSGVFSQQSFTSFDLSLFMTSSFEMDSRI